MTIYKKLKKKKIKLIIFALILLSFVTLVISYISYSNCYEYLGSIHEKPDFEAQTKCMDPIQVPGFLLYHLIGY